MTSTRSLAACLVAAALLALPSLAMAQEADAANGAKLFRLCTQCHGNAGEGNQAIGAPAISGLPGWYVQSQLVKFSSGLRGKHFDDIAGMRMRPMALWLIAPARAERVAKGEPAISTELDENIRDVAAHVGKLAPANPAPTITGGNVAAGEAQWALCGSCHGMQGEGSEPQSAPPLGPERLVPRRLDAEVQGDDARLRRSERSVRRDDGGHVERARRRPGREGRGRLHLDPQEVGAHAMAKPLKSPEELVSNSFWLTMGGLAAWIAAAFYIILN